MSLCVHHHPSAQQVLRKQHAVGTSSRYHRSTGVRVFACAGRGQPDVPSRKALSRRAELGALALGSVAYLAGGEVNAQAVTLTPSKSGSVDTTVTQTVYLDVGMCPSALNTNRAMGDKSALCKEPETIGRIEIGLYGNHLPITTSNFLKLIKSEVLVGTTFSKIFPGEYVLAGAAGSKRYGFVDASAWDLLEPNPERLAASSFLLDHTRPGTVSLAIGVNPDDPEIKDRSGYRSSSFLITTGPGPDFDLDGNNMVFGKVTKGLEAVQTMSTIPTFSPPIKLKQLNKLASVFGDERATKASKNWGKPQKALVITNVGIVS